MPQTPKPHIQYCQGKENSKAALTSGKRSLSVVALENNFSDSENVQGISRFYSHRQDFADMEEERFASILSLHSSLGPRHRGYTVEEGTPGSCPRSLVDTVEHCRDSGRKEVGHTDIVFGSQGGDKVVAVESTRSCVLSFLHYWNLFRTKIRIKKSEVK